MWVAVVFFLYRAVDIKLLVGLFLVTSSLVWRVR